MKMIRDNIAEAIVQRLVIASLRAANCLLAPADGYIVVFVSPFGTCACTDRIDDCALKPWKKMHEEIPF